MRTFIPAGPVPGIRDVLRMTLATAAGRHPWADIETFFYPSGRLALRDAVRKTPAQKGGVKRVWLPGYFCAEAAGPLRRDRLDLHFYPVGKDLCPDWDWLRREAKISRPDILVVVHYFGFPAALDEARRFSDGFGATIIEDAAHVLMPGAGVGEGNMTVYSPRKLLALPGGGLLTVPGRASTERDALRPVVFSGWAMKSIIKSAMFRAGIGWRGAAPCDRPKGVEQDAESASEKYEWAIKAMSDNVQGVMKRRRANFEYLSSGLRDFRGRGITFKGLDEGVCPYAFPILAQKRDLLLTRLHASGIPARSWPDLPAEVLRDRGVHSGAHWLRGRLVLLPVHQSLDEGHMNHIARSFKKAMRDGGGQ
ncbi:MAG TPA: DegT/DnrJ/EryC1/StrS family aminotransferase [Thermodesulfobacteriota bacterium]